jgi:predicted lipoprotein with Yx(FWY)xxD motif
MKRIVIVVTASVALLAAAGAAGAAGAGAAGARRAKLEVSRTALGSILANGRGFTLYVFTRDRRKHDSCVSIGDCPRIWPILKTHGRPRLGAGVNRSLVGTIKLPDGRRQVTYAGHPLYTYLGDTGPGDTSYVGFSQFGGRWYAIDPAGHVVK